MCCFCVGTPIKKEPPQGFPLKTSKNLAGGEFSLETIIDQCADDRGPSNACNLTRTMDEDRDWIASCSRNDGRRWTGDGAPRASRPTTRWGHGGTGEISSLKLLALGGRPYIIMPPWKWHSYTLVSLLWISSYPVNQLKSPSTVHV